MPPAVPNEDVQDVLASIRRIVAEENLAAPGKPTARPYASEARETVPDDPFPGPEFQAVGSSPVDTSLPSASALDAPSAPKTGAFADAADDHADDLHASGAGTPLPTRTEVMSVSGILKLGEHTAAPDVSEAPRDDAPVTGAAAPRAESLSGVQSETEARTAQEERRLAVFQEIRRQYEARVAERVARSREEETSDPELCKLLLTEDFQVRGPETPPVVHPAAPASREGYAEDSDRAENDGRVTLETVVRDAVADSVRAALNGGTVNEHDEMLDEEGFIDADTLRALVISIVHEELRGELGSQISARVRKLVRQEINRALQMDTLGY